MTSENGFMLTGRNIHTAVLLTIRSALELEVSTNNRIQFTRNNMALKRAKQLALKDNVKLRTKKQALAWVTERIAQEEKIRKMGRENNGSSPAH